MPRSNWNKIIITALLGFTPLAAGQDPLLALLEQYSQCLVVAATDDTPVAVATVADLNVIKGECQQQMAALTSLLPGDYLEPILAEVEQQAFTEIVARTGGAGE